jgi:DNA-binding transcriptional ArsR family regulator
MDAVELLLHPVRLRIVHAMSGGRERTTADLCARLPQVSQATVYRQVNLLVRGGLLEVAGERRVHGAVERRYRLSRTRPAIDRDRAAAMTLEEHRAVFVSAMAALVGEFDAYLDRGRADPLHDAVGYRQIPLWMSVPEVTELINDATRLIASMRANEPRPDRRLYLLSPILFPIEDAAET